MTTKSLLYKIYTHKSLFLNTEVANLLRFPLAEQDYRDVD